MALYFTGRDGKAIGPEWHVGDPVPKVASRVVTLQADGHELQLLLSAMATGAYEVEAAKNADPVLE